jgi:class 3 adenylate cyclase/tetratricopeptide (TPR) repeat protein
MSERPVERRVITALFVDVVGSTALTVQLGPERFKRALDQAFLELKAIINAEGGTLEKFIGDAIYAFFGAPTAHADDPQRALRAAYACAKWSVAHCKASVPLSVRVGLETGEAIVDLAATETERQQTSVGACVIWAARLQQHAEPGQILVGPVCHEMNAGAAEFVDLGEVELKGLGRQRVRRLVGLVAPSAGVALPFVGRDAELELLRTAYRRARSGRSVLALVSGPPGQGKTRLVEEFIAELGGEAQLVKARCRPAGELGARNPLWELLTSHNLGTSPDGLAARLDGLFPDALERHRVFTALAHSAGLIVVRELSQLSAEQRQDEIENGWRRYFAALARAGPLVVWADDVHWAEGEIVSLLDRLTRGAGMPLLIVATARPAFGAQAALSTGRDRFLITLDALHKAEVDSLARHAGNASPAGLERAEGNPLFIIELARARQIEMTWDVPITLKGTIGARLDELPTEDRELLQRVAVVGETFTVDDAILLSRRESADVLRALDRLATLLYLHPVPAGQRFQHALVRDVAYGRLTTAERMRLHARYAQDGLPPDQVEARAHHLWEAIGPPDAEWVWEGSAELAELRVRAREAHLAAARRYAGRFSYERAIEAGQRAFRFANDPADTARVEQEIGQIRAAEGNADDAWTHYLHSRDSYRELGREPPPELYPSFLELRVYTSGMFLHLPDDAFVETLIREGADVARRAGDLASLARLVALQAYRSHDATQLEEALHLSEQVADSASLGSFLGHAAILQNRVGEFAAAGRAYERLDRVAPASGPTDQQLEFRAILALCAGRIGEAKGLAKQFLTASASRGPHLRTHALREQSHVLLAQGNWRGLRELAAETERLVVEHPETAFCYAVTTVLSFAVVAYVLEGQRSEAQVLFLRAEAPLQAEPWERESVLLLASGVMGDQDKVTELRRNVREGEARPFWFYHRMDAVTLTMLERWGELDEVLRPLERVAAKGSPYVEALVAAIREEMAAARGGPTPVHRMLRELGYVGWSQLLAYRPAAQ